MTTYHLVLALFVGLLYTSLLVGLLLSQQATALKPQSLLTKAAARRRYYHALRRRQQQPFGLETIVE